VMLLLVGMLLAPGPLVAGDVDWGALFAGEVVVETAKHPDGFSGIRAFVAVAASRQRIWAALTDYTNFRAIFPDIQKMQVLAQDQHGARVEYWVNALVTHYHYVLYRRYNEPGRRLTWTQVAGDLKRIEGGWEIRDTPRPEVHLLVYESFVDIGGMLPVALVRLEAMRKTRQMSERLRNWIEGRPMPDNGSLTPEEETDRAREP
jgi:ribosome-associated toxin RatA of RatAB toxin-antitoxin module